MQLCGPFSQSWTHQSATGLHLEYQYVECLLPQRQQPQLQHQPQPLAMGDANEWIGLHWTTAGNELHTAWACPLEQST